MPDRGTSNSNDRGSAEDRRRRRAWLIDTHGIRRRRDGRPTRISCHHCHRVMRVTSKWEVDRFPVCGHAGGRYTRDNIVPACPPCNKNRCPQCAGARRRYYA